MAYSESDQWELDTRDIWEIHFDTRSQCSGYWHDKSCHLETAAQILWNSYSSGTNGLYDAGATYRMLMGMSFELLFKSFCVANSKEFSPTHNLPQLACQAGFQLEDKEQKIFSILSGYIYWEGRYPVPKPINTKKKKVSGAEGIKQQWWPFCNAVYEEGQNFIEEEPAIPSTLNRSDLDYENLFKLWQKFNQHYVDKHIAT